MIPQLLPNNIDKIYILDTGDLLVIKDLLDAYHWDIKDYLYAGAPAFGVGTLAKINNKTFDMYICCGSLLVNVKKVKEEHIYEKFVKYKNEYNCI